MPQASVSVLIAILRNAQQLGVDINRLQHDLEITSELLTRPYRRVDCELAFRLMQAAQDLTQDMLFGLHLGQQFQLADIGLPGYLLVNAPTLAAGLESLHRYQLIIGDGLLLNPEYLPGRIRICIAPHPELRTTPPRATMEFHLTGILAAVRLILADKVDPIQTRLGSEEPDQQLVKEYRDYFGTTVVFEKQEYSIDFPTELFARPLLTNNPELFQWFEYQASQIVDNLTISGDYCGRVSKEILQSFNGNRITLDVIAAQLSMSKRSLQRKLSDENTGFQKVLDETRQSAARFHLLQENLNIDEIAYLLGFTESSSFRKAFKRWTGLSPDAYRSSQTI